MKIIDKDGKLFGKINIIDFSVILFLLFFIPAFYFGYKVMRSESATQNKEWATVGVKFLDTIPELIGVIAKDDQAKDLFGNTVGKIIEVSTPKPSDTMVIVDNKTVAMLPHPFRKDITITLNILCTKKAKVLYYNESPVRIGGQLAFSTDLYTAQGTIISLKRDQ